jgi:hypothetical protein
MMVGGGLFDGFEAHPNVVVRVPGLPPSTAAGAYQFLRSTWTECAEALGLEDFSPENQDLAAVYLIRRRNALGDVMSGRLDAAVGRCNREWASLPGSPYGQPTKTMDKVREVYLQYGGTLDGVPHETESRSTNMPPFIAAALPLIVEAIPKLAKVFGSGSQVAERNIKAAETVVEIVKTATGAANAQEAVEKIKSDSAALMAATAAVESKWLELTEVGGGVVEARKADFGYSNGRFWHSPAFWITIALLPLVYIATYAVLLKGGFSSDIQAMVLGAIFGGLLTGGISAFWFGTSASSQRKTELLSK